MCLISAAEKHLNGSRRASSFKGLRLVYISSSSFSLLCSPYQGDHLLLPDLMEHNLPLHKSGVLVVDRNVTALQFLDKNESGMFEREALSWSPHGTEYNVVKKMLLVQDSLSVVIKSFISV